MWTRDQPPFKSTDPQYVHFEDVDIDELPKWHSLYISHYHPGPLEAIAGHIKYPYTSVSKHEFQNVRTTQSGKRVGNLVRVIEFHFSNEQDYLLAKMKLS